jgi:hypothetical protein
MLNNFKTPPTYKINGEARRIKKKEVASLKAYVKMFYFYNDIDKVYGGGIDEAEGEKRIAKARKQIEVMENELAIKF